MIEDVSRSDPVPQAGYDSRNESAERIYQDYHKPGSMNPFVIYSRLLTWLFRIFGLLLSLWSMIFILTMVIDQVSETIHWYRQSMLEFILSTGFFLLLFFIGIASFKKKTLFRK